MFNRILIIFNLNLNSHRRLVTTLLDSMGPGHLVRWFPGGL